MEKHYFRPDISTAGTAEYAEAFLQGLRDERKANINDVNSMIDPIYDSLDWENRTMTVKFIAKEWELNRVGVMHGGITATMLDHTGGCTACAFTGYWTPTIDETVKFISQINLGDKLTCTGHIIHLGKRFITLEVTMFNETSGRLAAQALCTFANGASNSSANK